MNKRGEILVEHVIFIILNLIFLGIMIVFLTNQSSGSIILEEVYSKQIALLIDSSRPGMVMELNMKELYKECKKKNCDFSKIINVSNNHVTVKLTDKGGYNYHFFNNVKVNFYNGQEESEGNYFFIISKNEE